MNVTASVSVRFYFVLNHIWIELLSIVVASYLASSSGFELGRLEDLSRIAEGQEFCGVNSHMRIRKVLWEA